MRHIIGIAVIGAMAVATGLGAQSQGAGRGRGAQKSALPVVVFQVDKKGSFEVEFYSNDAPKSVEHILTLVRRRRATCRRRRDGAAVGAGAPSVWRRSAGHAPTSWVPWRSRMQAIQRRPPTVRSTSA
jgi:hypothetical protein